MSIEKKDKLSILSAMILGFLLKSSALFSHTNIALISDHIGDLALPTCLSGLDWSELIAQTSYYGYGFKWPYTIFFVMTDNPYIIYMGIKLFYILLNSILAGVIYLFIIKYWRNQDSKHCIIYICWCAIMVTSAGTSMNSENAIFMSFFILCMFQTKLLLADTLKEKRQYNILIAFWLCYMLTIHERCLAVILAFSLLIFIWKAGTHEWIVDFKVFIPFFVSFYVMQELLTGSIIRHFWSAQNAAGTLKNTHVIQGNSLDFLNSFESIKIMAECICSNIYTLFIKTYGIGAIAVVLVCMILHNILRNAFCGTNISPSEQFFEKNKTIIFMLLLSSLTVIIIIFGLAIRWGISVSKGNPYGYKGYTYSRYYLPFSYPGVLAVLILWKQLELKHNKKIKAAILSIILLLTAFFAIYIYPLLSEANTKRNIAIERMGYFSGFKTWKFSTGIIVSIILMLLLICIFLYNARKNTLYSLSILVLIFFVQTNGLKMTFPTVGCSSFDISYRIIKNMESHTGLPKKIYYYGSNPYNCQFMLNRYSVSSAWPEMEKNAIIFSNLSPGGLTDEITENWTDFSYCVLGTDEYVYIKGSLYRTIFEKEGYRMISL